MNCISKPSLTVLLLATTLGVFPISCVDTGEGNDATGGRRSIDSGTGGRGTDVGGGPASGGCESNVDTTGDGTAGTTSTGPYQWKSVTIRGGGFVDGIIFSPIQKDLVFARTDMGGAYRYDAQNRGWVPLTDWISRANNNWIGIESIAADPVDPSIVYMAAGTYLTSTNTAILRSTDGGNTFTANAVLTIPMGGNHDGRSMGERLAIDPNLTSTLYFGSRQNGLLRSTDSGTTWNTVSSFPVVGGKTSTGTALGLSFVVFDPKSGTLGSASSTIYVGVADTTAGSNLYVSNDAGTSWRLVEGGPTALMPHHGVLDASGNLYLAYNNGPGPNGITLGGVWKYDTIDNTFSDISPGAHGIGGITVDAQKPGTLIAATLDWWAPDEIYRTTDGGVHWEAMGRNAKHDPNGAVWLRWGAGSCALPHNSGWMGDIEIDPFDSDHVMYVTGQGVWTTENASAAVNALTWTFDNRNLEQTAVTDMMPSVNGAFLSCVGDIAGMRHEDLDHPSPTGMYNSPISSNCTSLDFAGKNPDIVFRAGNPDSSNSTKYGGYSQDNGRTWTAFPATPLGATACTGGGKLAASADGSTVLWSIKCTAPSDATSTQAIFASSDMGATWAASVGIPTNATIAADRVNPTAFYGYSSNNSGGTFYVSTDSGRNFAAVSNTTPLTGRGVIRPVFGREGDVWLVANMRLYHSTQAGADFSLIGSVQSAYAVGFGKPAEGSSYPAVYLFGQVGNVTGFFRSEDEGITWTRIDDDQHQFGTAGYVAGDENVYGRVYIGTNGRGIIFGDPNLGN